MSPEDKESYMIMATMLAVVQGKAIPHLEATRNLKALHYAHKAEEALLKMFGHLTWERTDEEVQMLHDYMRRGIFRIDLSPPEETTRVSSP